MYKIGQRGNRIKKSTFDRGFDLCNIILQLLIAVVMVYPMLYVVFASFSDPIRFMAHKGVLLHSLGFTFDSYISAFQNPKLLSGYANTIFIVVVGVLVNMIMTSLGAYFLSRRGVKGKRFVTIYIMITMFFSGGMIPLYFVVRNLGLENSLWSVIIPGAISTYNLMILRVGFASVPQSLEESAKIDGAGHLTILFRIVMPVSKATLAVLVLYYAVGHWNAWFNAMLFLRDSAKYPLQLVLREILISNDTSSMTQGASAGELEYVGETIKYAIIVISTVPILCIYPFIQKYFTQGIMIGAVKE